MVVEICCLCIWCIFATKKLQKWIFTINFIQIKLNFKDHIEENSKEDMLEMVKNLGGWPVLGDEFKPEDFAWYKLSCK